MRVSLARLPVELLSDVGGEIVNVKLLFHRVRSLCSRLRRPDLWWYSAADKTWDSVVLSVGCGRRTKCRSIRWAAGFSYQTVKVSLTPLAGARGAYNCTERTPRSRRAGDCLVMCAKPAR
jgi:hypothetical protein